MFEGAPSAEAVSAAGPVIEARHISKQFSGVPVLKGLDLSIHVGEIIALAGKNGAGKSTAVKILSGALRPDTGELYLEGHRIGLASPADAQARGIVTVHQESNLFPNLTVRENLVLGWRRGRPKAADAALKALDSLSITIDLGITAADLSPHDQRLIAIARALQNEPRVLILDEPTSALAPQDVDALLGRLSALAGRGLPILYISHRLDELRAIANRIVVLRDGMHVGTLNGSEASTDAVVHLMLGDVQSERSSRRGGGSRALVLEAERLRTRRKLEGVSFQVSRGEVLGLWGVPGSGRTELLKAIFGLRPLIAGSMKIAGLPIRKLSPSAMINAGVGFSPQDRKHDALLPACSVLENVILACQAKLSWRGIRRRSRELQTFADLARRLEITPPEPTTGVMNLSGGNQQKVILARSLATKPEVLLLDEPTQGIDIGAKAEFYRELERLRESGVAIIIAPTEIEEVFLVCDRVLVLLDGAIVADEPVAGITPSQMMSAATRNGQFVRASGARS